MNSFYVRAALPGSIAPEAREALSEIFTRVASRFSFQGLEDYAVEVGSGEKVLGAEREFHDLRGRGTMNLEMRVYFRTKADGLAFRKLMAASLGEIRFTGPYLLGRKDWMKEWRKHYRTQIVREGKLAMAIVPAWKKPPAKPAVSVKIWPGQAFGTGTHGTTRLCLQGFMRVAESLPKKISLLDFGAGTGVLALAAMAWTSKAGGGRRIMAVAVESDPDALEQAGKNARLNRWDLKLALKMPARGRYDFVFANVLAPVLLKFRDSLLDSLKPGGWIVLSGILSTEVDGFWAEFSRGRKGRIANVTIDRDGDWASVLVRLKE